MANDQRCVTRTGRTEEKAYARNQDSVDVVAVLWSLSEPRELINSSPTSLIPQSAVLASYFIPIGHHEGAEGVTKPSRITEY